CGARFSIRYFLVELLVGVSFPLLFYFEVVRNPNAVQLFQESPLSLSVGVVGVAGYIYFAWHALLLSFLIVTALTDIDHMEIPLSVTLTGTVVGLIGSVLFPWPWPASPELLASPLLKQAGPNPFVTVVPINGLYPWPVWYPLPDWLPPGS